MLVKSVAAGPVDLKTPRRPQPQQLPLPMLLWIHGLAASSTRRGAPPWVPITPGIHRAARPSGGVGACCLAAPRSRRPRSPARRAAQICRCGAREVWIRMPPSPSLPGVRCAWGSARGIQRASCLLEALAPVALDGPNPRPAG